MEKEIKQYRLKTLTQISSKLKVPYYSLVKLKKKVGSEWPPVAAKEKSKANNQPINLYDSVIIQRLVEEHGLPVVKVEEGEIILSDFALIMGMQYSGCFDLRKNCPSFPQAHREVEVACSMTPVFLLDDAIEFRKLYRAGKHMEGKAVIDPNSIESMSRMFLSNPSMKLKRFFREENMPPPETKKVRIKGDWG